LRNKTNSEKKLRRAKRIFLILTLLFEFTLIVLDRSGVHLTGPFVDPWSFVHIFAGVLIGLYYFRWKTGLGLLILWEIIEPFIFLLGGIVFLEAQTPDFPEVPTNQITDVIIGFLGYLAAKMWKRRL